MPSLDRSFNSFHAAGTNGRLDFSLFLGTLVTQLVDHVKYGLSPGCHAWPRRVWFPCGEAQLAGCLKEFTGGPLA